jgi:hypothetical protein
MVGQSQGLDALDIARAAQRLPEAVLSFEAHAGLMEIPNVGQVQAELIN